MQRNGRKNFIRAIEQISKGNQSAADVVAELGTMKDGGILPDSYPESAEPDDDFLMLSDAKVSDGDRVLLIWTDAEEKNLPELIHCADEKMYKDKKRIKENTSSA